MGLFDFFTNRTSEVEQAPNVPWEPLNEMRQLDEILEVSKSVPVVIFKHSTRCGISRMVLRQFEKSYDMPEEAFKVYYLDLLAHRDISDEIAIRFQVIHQSPQLLIIKNGQTVYHASHHSIHSGDLERYR